MGFQLLETNMLQTATNAAATITAALIKAGDEGAKDDPQGTFDSLSESIMEPLRKQMKADNEQLKKEEGSGRSSGGSRGSGGGGYRSGGGGGGNVETDGSLQLSWSKFKGLTIAEIDAMSEGDVTEAGIDYDGSGRKWLTWLANNKNPKVSYAAKRAKAYLDNLKDGE